MKQFKEIDPLTVAAHPNLVATLPDATDAGNTFYFLLIDDYIVIADAQYFTNKRTGKSKWLHYQSEFPKNGLRWFLDTLEGKFLKLQRKADYPKANSTMKVLSMVSG